MGLYNQHQAEEQRGQAQLTFLPRYWTIKWWFTLKPSWYARQRNDCSRSYLIWPKLSVSGCEWGMGEAMTLFSDPCSTDLAFRSMPQNLSNNFLERRQFFPIHRGADWLSC